MDLNLKRYPLVSILIPNYNYGRYLENCLDSILNQTYPNYEVIFRDNCSTDSSLEIALEYRKKFKDKGIYFSVSQNKRNVGSDRNSQLCINDAEGEYLYVLASDDAIECNFIERCAEVLYQYPSVGLVITHRNEIDENGNVKSGLPFYNKSCVIPGEEQASVFMMAGIAIPGQRMFRRGVEAKVRNFKYSFQVAGDWFNNFLYTCCSDIAYIKEPLCRYRVHSGNETSESEINLVGIFEHYQLINSFCTISKAFGMKKPVQRYDEAVKKLAKMCLRYALKMINANKIDVAQRYLQLSPVFDKDIIQDKGYIDLTECCRIENLSEDLLHRINEKYNFNRSVSYNPPQGYISLE
ncbi:glycosyltransferase [Clostridium beijerinckii]|uniref:glycosyltransferase n=1 Tax=Clostridium beijerinckii TaxID=1520 RepID=UPI00232F745F|nr:glycosyltransferase [Clostridium beijerinckii]